MSNTARDMVEITPPSQHVEAHRPSDATAIVAMIERAATNPSVDLDKMERLLEMQERVMARQAKIAYDAAMAQMQPELPIIQERGGIRDRSGRVQSTYAKWDDINEAIKPVLSRHGFNLTFRTGEADGRIVVTGVLAHREGHREETTMSLPLDTSGSKNSVQAFGSSVSYGQRYTAKALLNLTSRMRDDADDDGVATGKTLRDLLDEGRKIAMEGGSVELGTWWTRTLRKDDRKGLADALPALKRIAETGKDEQITIGGE